MQVGNRALNYSQYINIFKDANKKVQSKRLFAFCLQISPELNMSHIRIFPVGGTRIARTWLLLRKQGAPIRQSPLFFVSSVQQIKNLTSDDNCMHPL